MITKKVIEPGMVMEFKMIGMCNVSEVNKIIEKEYKSISHAIIWNFDEAHISNLNSVDLQSMAQMAKKHSQHHKTAMISKSVLDFSMAKMYEKYSEMVASSHETRVFESRADALKWVYSSQERLIS